MTPQPISKKFEEEKSKFVGALPMENPFDDEDVDIRKLQEVYCSSIRPVNPGRRVFQFFNIFCISFYFFVFFLFFFFI